MDPAFDYTILGAGAVGSVFGGLLADTGFRVQLVNRSATTAQTVLQGGLTLELDRGTIACRPHAATPQDVRPARVVMIFTKTFQTRQALSALLPHITPETDIVTLQNGLGNGALVASLVPGNRVFHGVTMLPATLVAPGQVRSHGSHKTWLGPVAPADRARAAEICADLKRAGFDMVLPDNPATPIWQKACFNVAMNGTSALIAGSPGLIAHAEGLQDMVHELADEALAVANAEGAGIEAGAVHDLIDFACAKHLYHRPSMFQDIAAGRQTEVDSLNGYVVERAAVHGIDVPLNRLMLALVRGRQAAPDFWKGEPA